MLNQLSLYLIAYFLHIREEERKRAKPDVFRAVKALRRGFSPERYRNALYNVKSYLAVRRVSLTDSLALSQALICSRARLRTVNL